MGKTFRNIRDENRSSRGKNKTATREEKSIDKYRKLIYNKASPVNEDAEYDAFDEDTFDNETNHTQFIQRK